MGSLDGRDYKRMLDLTAAVVGGMLHEQPWFLVCRELNECLRGHATIFEADLRLSSRTSKILGWAPEPAGAAPFEPRVPVRGWEHPLAQLFATGGEHRPVTVNDLVDDRTWRRNSWYEATHRRFDGGIRHLGLPLPSADGTVRTFVTCRAGRDFGNREREFARLLQPLLVSLDRHLAELGRLRRAAPPEQAVARQQRAAAAGLTPRETIVIALLAEGLTAAAAARRLGISPHTVTKHQENAYRKLGTKDRLTTVLLAQELGIIGSPR